MAKAEACCWQQRWKVVEGKRLGPGDLQIEASAVQQCNFSALWGGNSSNTYISCMTAKKLRSQELHSNSRWSNSIHFQSCPNRLRVRCHQIQYHAFHVSFISTSPTFSLIGWCQGNEKQPPDGLFSIPEKELHRVVLSNQGCYRTSACSPWWPAIESKCCEKSSTHTDTKFTWLFFV